VHYGCLRENLPNTAGPPLTLRSGMPPVHDVSSAWKPIANAQTPCWRPKYGHKSARPWAHEVGFFYSERLTDKAVPHPQSPTHRSLAAVRPPMRAGTAPPHIVTGSCSGYMTWKPAVDALEASTASSSPARWLTPRFLNLPTSNEPQLMALPHPWGPRVIDPTQADGIARRWPVMLGA